MRFVSRWSVLLLLAGALSLGCDEYATPNQGADLGQLHGVNAPDRPTSVQEALEKKPTLHLPVAIAVARLQMTGCACHVANTSELSTAKSEDRLNNLPGVIRIAAINPTLVPDQIQSNIPLRTAAAQLHAGLLLIYTIDTTTQSSDLAAPLTIFTLGIAPDETSWVRATASAMLIDTNNGYVYGVCDRSVTKNTFTPAVWAQVARQDASREAEAEAFDEMSQQLVSLWGSVAREYSVAPATEPAQQAAP